tara:strand:- start:67778 stop:71431 length:3654 start_codon:yes stop_codon:yes gene_type:complete
MSMHHNTPELAIVSLEPDPSILERNLTALERKSPKAAAKIREATAKTDIEFALTQTGELYAVMEGRALCSKRQPIDEARTWAEQYDPQTCGFVGVLGFGVGHHLRALYENHQGFSVLLCFEPDLGLLRAVFERIDHSEWIQQSIFLLATDSRDASTLTQLLNQSEAFVATGVELAPHPPSKKRLEGTADEFSRTLLDVVRSTRTHLVTVLAHAGYTLRNILMNLKHYTTSAGVESLRDSCAGRTAVLVAAGPSLSRNLHLLEDPSVRERVVVIAVQTMLKPLLERGIKPDFVTALDHHEISKRFYEGLTKEDVDGVRLVVEPKANAAILDAFPGEILCATEKQLDLLLGEELTRPMGKLRAGATVAHLNYYLAKHLGCTNTILIGQDLGFTDGQYYASGASIHTVWSGELSEHRTLEMFEWERIARMKSLLRVKEDVYGREIFTDEQMSTYIAQFESDFQEDLASDPTSRIINATEGGVRIQGTESMSLQAALDECLDDQAVWIPTTEQLAQDNEQRRIKVRARLELVIRQLQSISKNSDRALKLISKAQSEIENPAHVDRCIAQIHTIRDDVMVSEPGFGLVNFVNQKGGLDRFKVDRKISLLKDLDKYEKIAKQFDRDATNIRWIKESSTEVQKLIERSLGVFEGTMLPMTRDEFADEIPEISSAPDSETSKRRVDAVIFADPDMGALGMPRNLGQPIHQGLNALELTIKRLQRCSTVDGITIITPDAAGIHAMGITEGPLPVRVVACDKERFQTRCKSIGQARIASSECWRGSIASIGCYDEGIDPHALHEVMKECSIDAAAIVGSDWAMVDPSLVDRIVSRHRSDPDRCKIPFSQAVPGIGCCVIERSVVETLVAAIESTSIFGSIGAMFSYIPVGPQGDPIASPLCVGVDPVIRDAGVRVVADSVIRMQAMSAAYAGLGNFAMDADASVLVQAFADELAKREARAPKRIQIELTTRRNTSGIWGTMHGGLGVDAHMRQDQARDLINQARHLRDDCSVLFAGRGDPLLHADAITIIEHARDSGVAGIELRTDLFEQPHAFEALLSAGLDVLSVDILADSEASYKAMTGTGNFGSMLDTMQNLFNARTTTPGVLPSPWIVPRITRCDLVHDDIKSFYDRWLSVCGCAVIDPSPNPEPTDRIQPLTVPKHRQQQLALNTLRIQADGQVVDQLGNPIPNTNALELGIERSFANYRTHVQQTSAIIEHKATALASTP